MKNNGKTHEVFDLAQYERSEELRKAKSHSKKNHSKFTLLRRQHPGNKVITKHYDIMDKKRVQFILCLFDYKVVWF